MILTYFTGAARQFKKQKLHTIINITGLGLGMMASVLAIMFVLDEYSFDRFHSKKDRLYRLNKINTESNGTTSLNSESSGMMGPTMVDEFAEVEKVVRFQPWYDEIVLSHEDKNEITKEGEIAFVDSTFFDVFDFKLLRGNPKTVLSRPLTMVLTEKTARTLFGEEDPIGKSITGMSGMQFEVTGIAEEPPRNSHIQFTGLMSWTTTVPQLGPLQYDWMNNWIAQALCTYVLVKEGSNVKDLEAKFPKFMQTHLPTRVDKYKLYLQPFTDLYLKSYNVTATRMAKAGNEQYVYLFSIIAGFILLLACINYVNISTSKSTRRAREVGMRKTMGASKRQLVWQFLGESTLLALCSAILGLVLIYLAIPFFNELAGKSLPMSLLLNRNVMLGVLALIVFVSFVSGLYPSFIISSFQPAQVLRAGTQSKITGHWPRHVLITFQFIVSISMIAVTALVYEQIQFVLSKDLGFDKEHVLVLNLTGDVVAKKEVLQKEVDAFAGVVSTSMGRTALGNGGTSTFIVPEGFPPDQVEIRMFPADGNFQKTYGLQMASGRFFDPTLASDSGALVINETLARRLHWDDPTKKTIKFNEGEVARPIIGVLKDFYFMSLYEQVQPLVMWISAQKPSNLSIRFTGNPANLLYFLEKQWKSYDSRNPFHYYFVDQAFAASYNSEQKLFRTVISFAGISIFIACLGLYGLVSFTIEQRTKEFGIRKVLGASIASLNLLINRKFILMVLLASGVAIPIVIPLANNWLQRFAFKTQLGPGIFILSILITLAITIVTVSAHSIKVARANPSDSLRHE